MARYLEAVATVQPVRRAWVLPRAVHALSLFCRRKPLGALGGFLVLVMLLMAVGAPWIAHYAYDESVPGARMKPPSAQFWMGTDNLSRDMWSRVVYGARVSVTVGFVTIALSTLVALAIGVSSASIGLGGVILAESSLSFLGLGVPPPRPSWGAMLAGSGRSFMQRAPWMAIFPGLAISLAVFGFNMLGDALRDVLDPRLRGTGTGPAR